MANFFSGLSTTKRQGSNNQAKLVGNWETGEYAFGKYTLRVDALLAKETKRDQHPLFIIEFTVVEVAVAADSDQNELDQSDPEVMEDSVSHEVGTSVSVAYTVIRNSKGALTEKGAKAMARLAAAIEGIIGLPAGTLDEDTANAVLDSPGDYTGGLVVAEVSGREWTNKDGVTGLWVQEYFSPSRAA